MFKEFADPVAFLELLTWEEVPVEIHGFILRHQEEELKQIWLAKGEAGTSYGDFKKQVLKNVRANTAPQRSPHPISQKDEIRRREEAERRFIFLDFDDSTH